MSIAALRSRDVVAFGAGGVLGTAAAGGVLGAVADDDASSRVNHGVLAAGATVVAGGAIAAAALHSPAGRGLAKLGAAGFVALPVMLAVGLIQTTSGD